VQRKLSVHLSDVRGEKRLTLVGHPTGFILKPQTPEYPQLPELEHLTMTLAGLVGVTTVPHGLIRLEDGSLAYITRRIDRDIARNRRVPMEDACQLSERLTEDKYRGSYEQVARIIARYSSRPGLDLTEFFLVLVCSFVTGNADMHLKNFSLFAPQAEWVLTPAYDLVATKVVLPEDDEEMALTIGGKKRKLGAADFLAFGASIGVHEKAAPRLIESVVRAAETMTKRIEASLLAPSARERFIATIRERVARLQL
jgi:serine/threonine-protein kinase HipA